MVLLGVIFRPRNHLVRSNDFVYKSRLKEKSSVRMICKNTPRNGLGAPVGLSGLGAVLGSATGGFRVRVPKCMASEY